jgi:hypothetical protein
VVNAQALAGAYSSASSHATRIERFAETLPKSTSRSAYIEATHALASLYAASFRQAARKSPPHRRRLRRSLSLLC